MVTQYKAVDESCEGCNMAIYVGSFVGANRQLIRQLLRGVAIFMSVAVHALISSRQMDLLGNKWIRSRIESVEVGLAQQNDGYTIEAMAQSWALVGGNYHGGRLAIRLSVGVICSSGDISRRSTYEGIVEK